MPKLPVISGIEAVKALSKIGYEVDHQTGSHIILRQNKYPHRRSTQPYRNRKRDFKGSNQTGWINSRRIYGTSLRQSSKLKSSELHAIYKNLSPERSISHGAPGESGSVGDTRSQFSLSPPPYHLSRRVAKMNRAAFE
jgi:predicted RNA binding protein YcfA (HicA-like mRNA interferase family)